MIPVDRPTVANAESTSNSTRDSGRSVTSSSAMHETSTMLAPVNTTAIDSRSTSRGMRRPNASMSRSPRASATIASSMTASVVTLIPPAVDADPPPTNISASWMSQLDCVMAPTSTVLNPPERGMIPAKRAASSFSPKLSGPNVPGLVHSSTSSSSAPTTSSAPLVTSVSLLCRESRLVQLCQRWPGRGSARWMLRITGKPSAPMNTPRAIGSTSAQSPTCGIRPSVVGTKPALLNAEIP